MKKTILLMVLGAFLAGAQITSPVNGSMIAAGPGSINLCWQMGGAALAAAGGPSGIPVYTSGYLYAYIQESSTQAVVLGSTGFTSAGCYAVSPSVPGVLTVNMLMFTCSSCAAAPWTFSYPVLAAPPAGSNTTVTTSQTQTLQSSLPPPDDYVPAGQYSDIALNMPASQSSTLYLDCCDEPWGLASAAVDGNTDGNWFDGVGSQTISIADDSAYAWWEVDLGQPGDINSIVIWPRTDSTYWNPSAMSNYYVFISNTPFQASDTPATLINRPGTWSSYQGGYAVPATIPVGGAAGRYVRIQLNYTNYLCLAEVQVMGAFDGQGFPAVMRKTKLVQTKTAGVVEIPRGDVLNPGNLQYAFSGNGPYTYSYTFDNSDVSMIRIGDMHDQDLAAVSSVKPAGWVGSGMTGWFAGINPARSTAALYSVTSTKAPGLQPIFLQSDAFNITGAMNGKGEPIGLPYTGDRHDNAAIMAAGGLFGNSVRQFVIGPVFDPGVTKDQILERVGVWVKSYGFSFLAPLLTGGSLPDLQPSSQLEKDLVAALSQVWQ